MSKAYSLFRLRNGYTLTCRCLSFRRTMLRRRMAAVAEVPLYHGPRADAVNLRKATESILPVYMHVDYGRVCAAGRIRTSGYQPAQVAL